MSKNDKRDRYYKTDRHYASLDILLIFFWLFITGTLFTLYTLDNLTIYSLILGIFTVFIVSQISHRFVLNGEKRQIVSLNGYLSKLKDWTFLLSHLFVQLIISNASLVRQTFTKDIEPKIVHVPVDLKSESELTLLSCMITITPGTLVLKTEEVEDGYILKTHFSYLPSEKVQPMIESTIKRWEVVIRGLFG